MAYKMSTFNFKERACVHLCLIILLSTFANGDLKQSHRCPRRQDTFSDTILSLASRLINEIGEEDNFIISPLSISAALAMLYVGANGLTKIQMSNALHYNVSGSKSPDSIILESVRDLILSLKMDSDELALLAANSVFIQKGFRVSPDYLYKVRDYFDSEVNYVDFSHEEQISMKTINQWVNDKTRTQVKKLLNEPLDTVTLMVLANVIYFKGLWVHPFTETWNSYFHTINGTAKTAAFMKTEEYFNYYHDVDTNYSFLELPYMGGNISMLLVLPLNTNELPKFQLTRQSLCHIRSRLEMRHVMVGLPRIQMGYRRELSQDLSKFGMTKLFSDRADLTGIREQNDLHVSLMIHKAVIEINEHGSRASGIAGIGINSRRKPSRDAMFWANHPFLFYIIDTRMETILFVGRVTDI